MFQSNFENKKQNVMVEKIFVNMFAEQLCKIQDTILIAANKV